MFLAILLTACGSVSDNEVSGTELLPMQAEAPHLFKEPEELIGYINDSKNGYVKTKAIGQIVYTGVLKPIDFLVAQKRRESGNAKFSKKDIENLQYFDLRIKIDDFSGEFLKYDLNSPQQYKDRVYYCAFDMQKDLKLLDGKDTLECVLYHFERGFDVIPFGHFLLAFEPCKAKLVQPKTLVFEDKLFNNGIIKFTFLPENMVKEPTLF